MTRSTGVARRVRALAALAVIAVTVGACDSDRRAISRDDLPQLRDDAAVVVLDDDGFDLDELDVSTVDVVTFRIEGSTPRGIRAGTTIDTGLLPPGSETDVVFDDPADYRVVDVADDDHELLVRSRP